MISKMSVIAFTAGLVAALCVTDVNAVVWETCKFSDSECKYLNAARISSNVILLTIYHHRRPVFLLFFFFLFLTMNLLSSKSPCTYHHTRTIKYIGKNVIEDSCLGGKEQPDGFADYYQARQDGSDDDSNIAPKDFKTCKQLAKAYNKANDDDTYDDKKWLEYIEEVRSCQEDPNQAGEYYGQRCGASFTGSSMAALFGLLCVSLALW